MNLLYYCLAIPAAVLLVAFGAAIWEELRPYMVRS